MSTKTDTALLELDPQRPESASSILAALGRPELGQAYANACAALNRCGTAFMQHRLMNEPQSDFDAALNSHKGFQAAKLAKEKAWEPIEQLREEARARIAQQTPAP